MCQLLRHAFPVLRVGVLQLRALLAELDLTMAIDGYSTIADLRAAGAQRV
jgi:hypothetical protein